MLIFGHKLQYIWYQVHRNEPYIHLGSHNRKPNLDISLILLPPPQSSLFPNFINYLISKPLQSIPNSILMNPLDLYLPLKSSIIFDTTSSFNLSCPRQLTSILDNMLTWIRIPAKGCMLLVVSHGCLTADSEMLILWRFTNQKE